jgi:anti-sigma regulatory factor (Ser/Thr protein kinase)
MASRKQILMYSRLRDIPATIERLRLDSELQSCIEGREFAFTVAMQEALANAIVHGNHREVTRKVYVRYICEPGHALSILIRDEGDGFDPSNISSAKATDIDHGMGIRLMRASMDEVRFRKGGTEIYMRMNARERQRSRDGIPDETSGARHAENYG